MPNDFFFCGRPTPPPIDKKTKSQLAIVIVTYNRAPYLEKTLAAVLAEDSPVRDCPITVFNNRHLPDDPALRSDPAVQLQQMTFLPSIIYGPGVITATAVRNAYDSTFALFQHLVPVIMHLNAGGTIWTAPKGIVVPGDYGIDISYTRGDKREDVFNQSRTMVLSAGFAYVTANLRDRKLSKRAFAARE